MSRQRGKSDAPASAPIGSLGQSLSLYIIVFVCGAVLMAFEMVGSRILAPRFGNTIFVWGSLIGVFLAALSLGYLVGGRLADWVPKFSLLGGIIAVAGLLILVVPLYAPACCGWIDRAGPGQRMNPLYASLLLFFAPSVLLGMVSPFAIRLQARSVATVGNVAGRLYALSTLGSIAGTLLATFWMIPSFGTANIVRGLGVCLVAASLLAIVPRVLDAVGRGRGSGAVAAGLLVGVTVILGLTRSPSLIQVDPEDKLVVETDSAYQHIGILLGPWGRGENAWSLQMKFDKYIESEVLVEVDEEGKTRIREPYESGAKYTDTLHLPFLFNKDARSVLIVGGGGGVVPTVFRRHYPQLEAIDVVEIDPVVLSLAEEHFGFRPGEGGVTATLMDGRVYLRGCKRAEKAYDIIILDAFTGGRPPFHLLTKEFLELVGECLTAKGVVHLNIISAIEGEKGQLFWAMLKTFVAAFGRDRVYVFPKWYDPRWGHSASRREGINIELVATNFDDLQRPLPAKEIERRAIEYHDSFIKIDSIIVHAGNHQPLSKLLSRGETELGVREILDWPGFCARLSEAGAGTAKGVSARIWELLPAEARTAVQEIAQERGAVATSGSPVAQASGEPLAATSPAEAATREKQRAQVLQSLNEMVKRRDFCRQGEFPSVPLLAEATELSQPILDAMTDAQVVWVNRLLLEAAYPREVAKSLPDEWGRAPILTDDYAPVDNMVID